MLWISDASPLFVYSPAKVYFSGGASWTGVAEANGTSHSTAGPAQVILPLIFATDFIPEFEASSYSTTLAVGKLKAQAWQSGQNISFTEFEQQTFLLSVNCTVDQCAGQDNSFDFKGAWIGTNLAPAGLEAQSVLLDDASSAVTYSGFTAASDSSAPNGITVESTDDLGTLSYTTTNGATANVKFNGASIIVRGVTGPSTGSFTVDMDGSTVATLNSTNNIVSHNVILYFATNLDTSSQHSLTLTAEGGLVIDSFAAYGPQGGVGFINASGSTITSPAVTTTATGDEQSTNTSTTAGMTGTSGVQKSGSPNVGVIVGAVLGALAGVLLLLWLFRRHVMAKPAPAVSAVSEDPWDKANNLQNQKAEGVHVTTAYEHRYRYPSLAHLKLAASPTAN